MAITVRTEAGEVVVESKEQAVRMIQATAHHQSLFSEKELREVEAIVTLSEYFQISLSDFKLCVDPDIEGHHKGFSPNIIRYTDGEDNWEYVPKVILINIGEWDDLSEDGETSELVLNHLIERFPSLAQTSTSINYLEIDDVTKSVMADIISQTNDAPVSIFVFNNPSVTFEVLEIIKRDVVMNYKGMELAVLNYQDELESFECQYHLYGKALDSTSELYKDFENTGRYLDISNFLQELYDGQ